MCGGENGKLQSPVGDHGKEKDQSVPADQGVWLKLRSDEPSEKNTYVSTHTLETLCRILDCRIEDVMEVSFEDERAKNRFTDSDLYRKDSD